MCFGPIRQAIQPNEKLQKMLTFVKIILIINFLSSILRIWININELFYDLICALFLMMAYFSVYFIYMAMYEIFCLFNGFFLFVKLAIFLQVLLQMPDYKINSKQVVSLSFTIYLFVFYIFAVIITYPVYKEMKAQLMEGVGGGSYRSSADQSSAGNAQPDQERPDNSGGRFVAFSGRGVPLGGDA